MEYQCQQTTENQFDKVKLISDNDGRKYLSGWEVVGQLKKCELVTLNKLDLNLPIELVQLHAVFGLPGETNINKQQICHFIYKKTIV